MKLARLYTYSLALMLPGLCLQATASVPVLDDPACIKRLAPEELRGLKLCLERNTICMKHWPTQTEDIQTCDASVAWIRNAMIWPLAQRHEVFGTAWPADTIGVPASEPAWKKLPRTGNATTTTPVNIPQNAKTNPYAGTSSAITPEAAKAAGWNLGVITGVITTAGQIAQDRSALENPEAAAQAKEVLSSVGLGEYAASDKAIAQGRIAAIRKGNPSTSLFIPHYLQAPQCPVRPELAEADRKPLPREMRIVKYKPEQCAGARDAFEIQANHFWALMTEYYPNKGEGLGHIDNGEWGSPSWAKKTGDDILRGKGDYLGNGGLEVSFNPRGVQSQLWFFGRRSDHALCLLEKDMENQTSAGGFAEDYAIVRARYNIAVSQADASACMVLTLPSE